jgi:ABC-type branched-subunit amino acid transport system substrate-binding protein/DNA-binding beta-propeller fold protein YncE
MVDDRRRVMSVAAGPGSTFGGYRIESLLGRGGMGVVYRATDLSLDRPVALKLVAPELAEDERFRSRFMNEPRLAAALDHPHVVPIYEAGEHDGQLFLAMRYVEGSDLKTVLERGRLAPERALSVLAQVADALDAAHRRGLVHRDVKPANVLLDEDGHAYLTDFGVSKQSGGPSTDTGRLAGTLDYLAPEQIRGEEVDGRTDCYALACVLYECLAGTPPFRRETEAETLWAHLREPPPALGRYPELELVLAKALAKEKEGRYATCRELLDAASAALDFEAPARRARRLRIGRRLLLAGAALLLAAAVAAAVLELTRDGEPARARPEVAPDSLAVLDPASNRIVGQVPIPGRPSLVAAHGRSVWVSNVDRTLSKVDVRRLSVTKVVPAAAIPEDLVATADAVWLLDGEFHAPVNRLVKVDTAHGSVVERVALPAGKPRGTVSRRLLIRTGRGGVGVDVGRDAVWVAGGTTRLLKLDPRDAGVVRAFDLPRPLIDVAVGTGAVWGITGASARVLELDPRTGSVRARIPITGRPGATRPIPIAVAASEDALWVLNGNAPSVTRIDPELSAVTATIPLPVGSNPTAIATGAGAVWVATSGEGAVARIDPSTGAVRSIPVGGAPTGVAVSHGRVWIAVQPRAGLAGRVRTVRVPGAISESYCTPPEFAGEGRPRFLIVSDLPLQYPVGATPSLQFADAVRFVLARRDFTAGRYSVGFQSCDHSTLGRGGGWTPATCRRNARAIADAPIVLGIVGPFNSGCVAEELPILGRARDGPLAAVSGSATVVGLTQRGPGSLPGEPRSYYPRGVRNFARVIAADDVQAAAVVMIAKRLGVRRLYVLNDLEGYGIAIAANVRAAARKLGVGIAGAAGWDVVDRGYRDLAQRIVRSGADGVFLGGILPAGGTRLVRDLRAVLGRRFPILAPDGFSEMNLLVEAAGQAAEGVVISIPIVPPAHLPPTGRRFVEAFEKAIGGRADPYSITTAQAAAVLLDAIVASDGTRASVTRNLLRTRVEDGILGSFEFDANGDTTAGGVTIYRIEEGKPRVLSVITPPKSLR